MATSPVTPDRPRDPFSPALQRATALSGVSFAVLLITTIALSSGQTPDFDAPVEEWSRYAADNSEGTRLAALAFALATYAFVLWLGYLRSTLDQAEHAARGFARAGHFVTVGGTIGITGMLLAIAMGAAALLHEDAPPEMIRAVSAVSSAGFILAAPAFAAMLVSTFLISRGTGALPGWLSWVALATGVFFLLQLLTLLSKEGDNSFGFAYPLAFLGLVVFTIGTSLYFVKRIE
jgi:hypothetical protein